MINMAFSAEASHAGPEEIAQSIARSARCGWRPSPLEMGATALALRYDLSLARRVATFFIPFPACQLWVVSHIVDLVEAGDNQAVVFARRWADMRIGSHGRALLDFVEANRERLPQMMACSGMLAYGSNAPLARSWLMRAAAAGSWEAEVVGAILKFLSANRARMAAPGGRTGRETARMEFDCVRALVSRAPHYYDFLALLLHTLVGTPRLNLCELAAGVQAESPVCACLLARELRGSDPRRVGLLLRMAESRATTYPNSPQLLRLLAECDTRIATRLARRLAIVPVPDVARSEALDPIDPQTSFDDRCCFWLLSLE
jgi:hypothetical protein